MVSAVGRSRSSTFRRSREMGEYDCRENIPAFYRRQRTKCCILWYTVRYNGAVLVCTTPTRERDRESHSCSRCSVFALSSVECGSRVSGVFVLCTTYVVFVVSLPLQHHYLRGCLLCYVTVFKNPLCVPLSQRWSSA